jgi:hypothetical protein
MESMIWLVPAAAPWVETLFLGVVVLIMVSYFVSAAQVPVRRIRVDCPESGLPAKIWMKMNIFRDPRKIGKGVDIVGCQRFSGEEVTCSKGCLLTGKVQQLHRLEGRRHTEKNSILALNK